MSDEKEHGGSEQWEDPTNEYGKPGYSSETRDDDEPDWGNNTVELSTLPGPPPPVSQDDVATEASSPEFASQTILEVPVPPVPEGFEQSTTLDVSGAATLDDDPTEAREQPSDAGFLDESTRIEEGVLDRYREELAARRAAGADDDPFNEPADDGMDFDDATDFELPRPALEDVPQDAPSPQEPDEEPDPFELADASPGFEGDPFGAPGARLTTIPDVIPSDKSAVSQLTDQDAERLSQTDEFAIPREARGSHAASSGEEAEEPSTLDGISPPLADLDADDELTDAAEPPSTTRDDLGASREPLEQELALGTRDISVESQGHDPSPDLSDAGPEALPPAKSGPKGTLVLEVGEDGVSQEVDPAMLPPAFPATTGNVLENATNAMPRKPPPPPAGAADLAERGPEDDAWAGYDDSGGWHTLTGESQVLMADSAKRDGPPPPPVPMAQASSSAVFDSSQPGAARERAQLVGIQGADTGRQHSITGDEVLIGRSSRCSIVLAEPSVSRQHARIERRDDGFWVVDLDSGNGTYVNGQRVSEFRIFSGDEVTFGNGSFQFIETGERFEPVDASAAPVRPEAAHAPTPSGPPWLQPLPLVIASAVMLVVVGAVFVTLQVSANREEQKLRKAFLAWQLGRENFSQQQWNQAERAFNEALEWVPGHRRSLRYLDALRREREAQKVLVEAETALEQEEYATAFDLASRATDSIAYGQDAEKVIERVDEVMERRLRRARAAKDRIEAVEILQGFEFMEPYRPEISRLRREGPSRSDDPVEEVEEAPPKKEESGAVDDDRRDGAAHPGRTTGEPAPASTSAVARARAAFVAGELAEAKRQIAGDRSAEGIRLGDLLQRFDDVYRAAKTAFRAKRAAAAVSELDEALALEGRIAAGKSSFARAIKKQLAGAHYLQGVDRFTRNEYPQAYAAFRESLQLDPSRPESQRMLNRLGDRAKELLDQARGAPPERARSLYETVLLMVPAGHDAYRSAKQGLKRVR